ncbi:hypothetical protein [uncultured Helicobacter sp.]|uniref:hypothetical protein n=1 Tax=uncultured Helicobacter sp. TaxID=175537 RepID=UPI00374FAF1C
MLHNKFKNQEDKTKTIKSLCQKGYGVVPIYITQNYEMIKEQQAQTPKLQKTKKTRRK